MRVSTKKVNEVIKLLNDEKTTYKLIRIEHPTGTSYWYTYTIGKYVDERMEYVEGTYNLSLKQIYDIAFKMLHKKYI